MNQTIRKKQWLNDRTSIIILSGIILVYVVFAWQGMTDESFYPDYNVWVKSAIGWWPDYFDWFDVHLRFAILKTSVILFDNVKVVPFMISLGVLVTSYYSVKKFGGSNIGALLAVMIISTSNLFGYFDSSAAYDNTWILLYMLSLLVIEKKWQASPILFAASIFCKPLTVLFLPASIFFVWKSNLPHKKKLMTIYGLMFVALLAVSILSGYTEFTLDGTGIMMGFTDWWDWLSIDPYMQLMIPVSWAVLIAFHFKGNHHALQLLVLQGVVILSGVMVETFTTLHNEPYRYLPLVIFFAVSVGMMFDKNLKPLKRKKEHSVSTAK